MKYLSILIFIPLLSGCGQTPKVVDPEKAGTTKHKIIFPANEYKTQEFQIKQLIYSALSKCNEYIQSDSLTISVSKVDDRYRKIAKLMGGVTGITFNSKQMLIEIDTSVASWKEMLKLTIAHEYNHAYDFKTPSNNLYSSTLLQYLVFEGKADNFAYFIYPNINSSWTHALTEKEKIALWDTLKPKLQLCDFSFNREVMFGSKSYPKWGGYTIGFDIVKTALKNNPNMSVAKWTNLSADKLLGMSDYKLEVKK